MAKIEKLTAEQEVHLVEFRAEYLAHGLSTAPADRQRAEAAFARAYRAIGREPVPVIWVSSPLSACVAFAALEHLALPENALKGDQLRGQLGDQLRGQLGDQLWDQLRDQLRDQLGDQLRGQLWGQLGDQLWGQLRGQLWGQLRDQLGDQLGGQLRDQLGDQLWDQLRDQLGDQLGDQLWGQLRDQLGDQLWGQLRDQQISFQDTYWWGQQDMFWIAFYKFAAEIGVRYPESATDRLDIMHEIGLSCMWWYPRDGLIIACNRPLAIHKDEAGRLHNSLGAAVVFRDGWKIHAVHGVRVPEWIIESKEKITIDTIDAEQNTEIQRVMIELFGWDRFSDESGAVVIDHDERWGTLCRRGDGSDAILFLRVINRTAEPDGTFRKYVLPIDSECRPLPDPEKVGDTMGEPQRLTALNAVASTFGLRGEEYAALIGAES